MIRQPFDHLAAARFLTSLWRSVRQRAAGLVPPRRGPAALAGRRRWMLYQIGLTLGLLGQMLLLWLSWELVDLCISLMELWAELARKHLELTL